MPKPKRGRASIFRGKDSGVRVQGLITKVGGQKFEERRKELASLYLATVGLKATTVSDADVIEYLSRGRADTRAYLEVFKGH